ncbi:MAG: AAA family ATPase [Roseomonas mucosa]|nr:AAA family ATPase [Roseomonas mucosa]
MILTHVDVRGFRHVFSVKSDFHGEVNYIIGHNGTGKTSFVRLLVAALKADTGSLVRTPFTSIELHFKVRENGSVFKLVYTRVEDLEKSIDERGQAFRVSLYRPDLEAIETSNIWLDRIRRNIDASLTSSVLIDESIWTVQPEFYFEVSTEKTIRHRRVNTRKYQANAREIWRFIKENIQVRWLPIERTLRDDEQEIRRSTNSVTQGPVNRKVMEVQNSLVRYFSELDKRKSEQLELFRNHSLLALFNIEVSQGNKNIAKTRVSSIEVELDKLIPELRLDAHLEKSFREKSKHLLDWLKTRKGRPIEVLRQSLARLEEVLSQWRQAQLEISRIFEKKEVYLSALEDAFSFAELGQSSQAKFSKTPKLHSNNELDFVQNIGGEERSIRLLDLSSGEKQFFIMLSEALLERDAETLLIIDEPELSLHISWQARLVKDLLLLNPNVQLILATHSPDMISTEVHGLLQMEKVVSFTHE